MNNSVVKNTIRNIVLCITVGTAIICAGAAIMAGLIVREILDAEYLSYGLYAILLVSGSVLTIVTSEENKVVATLFSFLSLLGILLIGNVIINHGHISNVIGTTLSVICGAVLPNIIHIKKISRNKKPYKSKMVNLYKNRR